MPFDFPDPTRRAAWLAGCLSLGLAHESVAAEALEAHSRVEPAEKCAGDLRAFDGELQKGGYWRHNSSFGFGYPMYGYIYGDTVGMIPYGPLVPM